MLKEPASLSVQKQRLMERWVRWLFDSLIVPMLRERFYITEAQGMRYKVFYFRFARIPSLIITAGLRDP